MKHEEAKIQAAICQLLQVHKIFFHSVPNELAGGGGKNVVIRMSQFKAVGLRPGVADLVVWFPSGIAYVEVKTPIGKLSDSQVRFKRRCREYGVPYHVVRSVEDVEKLIESDEN
jgi:hypothetical protein